MKTGSANEDVAVARDGQDDAIAMVGEQQHEIDPIVEARVIRKIDWFLVPAMVIGCM